MNKTEKEVFKNNIIKNQTVINNLAEQTLQALLRQVSIITGKEATYSIFYDGKVFVWIGGGDETDGKFNTIDDAVVHYSRKIGGIYKKIFG